MRRVIGALIVCAVAGCDQTSANADGELKFVVAAFRHGVRAPLADFAAHANEHSGQPWPPTPQDWGARDWGELTTRGGMIVSHLGEYYGTHYTAIWPAGMKAYLWADVDPRTKDTALALQAGMARQPRVDVTVEFRDGGTDPLYHPFKSACGVPAAGELTRIAQALDRDDASLVAKYQPELGEIESTLACVAPPPQGATCSPLSGVADVATAWQPGQDRKSSPIDWKGRFSYASSASEAFVLEYANNMQAAWGRDAKLGEMLRLHELYFDRTEREPYLAKVNGSALLREISDQLNRQAGGATRGLCPRGNASAQFVGLVGHDTNLASLNALLGIGWKLDDVPGMGTGMSGFAANDALPAGALVFELYRRGRTYSVRIEYVSFTPAQMKDGGSGQPFRIPTTCNGVTPCDIPLETFNKRVADALGADNPFVTGCTADGKQVCLLRD